MVVDGCDSRQLIINQINEAGVGRHMIPLLLLIDYIKNDFQLTLNAEDIEFISSGGSSVVIAIHNHTSISDRVFQYYEDYTVVMNIQQLYKMVWIESNQVMNLATINGHSYHSPRLHINYDLSDFLVRPHSWHLELQTIVWDKIQPVTHLPQAWLMTQIHHLIWDIGKAITGLHQIGYSHGDVRTDNLGWNGKRFVLYDFNMTKPHHPNQYSNDYLTFGNSLRDCLHVPKDQYVPLAKVDYQFFLLNLKEKDLKTYEQVITYLEKSSE
jgi:hypothetical protein